MTPWIKKPKNINQEINREHSTIGHRDRSAFTTIARTNEESEAKVDGTAPEEVNVTENVSSEAVSGEQMVDELFAEPAAEISMESTQEDNAMSTPTNEEMFKKQMDEFLAKSAMLQNLIDQQNAQLNAAGAQMNMGYTSGVHMPAGQPMMGNYGAPTNAFNQPVFNTGFANNGYSQTGYVGNGYAGAPMGQFAGNYQPQAVFQQTMPMQANPYAQGMPQPMPQPVPDTPEVTPVMVSPDGATNDDSYPRYPYPSPESNPGGEQVAAEAPVPTIHTVDLTGIVDDFKSTVDARINPIQEDVVDLQADLTGVRDEVSGIKTDVADIRTQVAGVQSGIDNIQGNISNDMDEFSVALKKEMEAATASIAAETRAAFEEQKTTLTETKAALEEATKTMERHTQSFEGLKEQLDILTGRTESIDTLNEKMDMSMSDLKTDISDKIHTEDVKCFRNIQSSMKEQTDTTDAGLNRIADALQTRISATEDRVESNSKLITVAMIFSIISTLGVVGALLMQLGIINV